MPSDVRSEAKKDQRDEVLGTELSESVGASSSQNSVEGRPPGQDMNVASSTMSTRYCDLCTRAGQRNVFNTAACVALQKRTSCHACGGGPDAGNGQSCWTSNPDCPYYRYSAGQRDASVDARATGSAAPNMLPVRPVRFFFDGPRRARRAVVDNSEYMVGFASGAGYNCLIHSLATAVGDHFPFNPDIPWIRQQLIREFSTDDASQVTENNFLYFEFHARSILRHFAMMPRMGDTGPIRPGTFTVRLIDQRYAHVADEVGTGSVTLYLMNQGNMHFVPFVRTRSR